MKPERIEHLAHGTFGTRERFAFAMRCFGIYFCNHIVSKIPCHRLRLSFFRNVMNFEVGLGSSINLGAEFDARSGLTIGTASTINANCRFDTRGGIVIGDNVSVSRDVTFLTADHDLQDPHFSTLLGPITLGNFVFVGTGATILRGVTIGEGAAVAARSVVTKDVEPYAIVAGVPARRIGTRTRQLEYDVNFRAPFH